MNLALWTVVALLAAASALRFALSAWVVDREHLYAALSAYLLAGVFFGVFYLGHQAHLVRLVCRTRRGCPEQFFTHRGNLL